MTNASSRRDKSLDDGITREERTRLDREHAEKEHKAFQEKFRAGSCWVCGDPLTAFDVGKPCPHWLLKPEGFGKEHFGQLAEQFSLNKIEHYLRWVANEEVFAQNINDLADEGSGKLVELTIKYKNLRWSLSCGANDFSGHQGGGEHSKRPHWHFQMYVDDRPFIRFNDFHAPLSTEDIELFARVRDNPKKVRRRFAGGDGMGDVLHESTLEQVVAAGRSGTTDAEASTAPIELSTILIAEPGTTIKGEDIYNAIQAARAEGTTATSKLRELRDVSMTTLVSAGPGVVTQAVRSGRRKGKGGDRLLVQQDRAWRELLKRKSGSPE